MATLRAYYSFDMFNVSSWSGYVSYYSSSRVVVNSYFDDLIGIYKGKGFKYKKGNVADGTLTGYSEKYYDYSVGSYQTYWEVSGGKISAKKAANYVNSFEADKLAAIFLSGNDKIYGSFEADKLRGFKGNDKIYGGDGFDFIFGDQGNDRIYGGGGSDTIFGGLGNDKLTGNSGEDAFVFNYKPSKNNFDTITDFISGTDGLILFASIFKKLENDSDLSDNFVVGSKSKDNNDYLIFNPSNNTLYYDADGNGKTKPVAVVKLAGVTEIDPLIDLFVI